MQCAYYSKIRFLCRTRCTFGAKALYSIHNNYKPIQEWLALCEDSKNNSDPDSHARTGGLCKGMKSFNFMYGLKLSMMYWTIQIVLVLRSQLQIFVQLTPKKMLGW